MSFASDLSPALTSTMITLWIVLALVSLFVFLKTKGQTSGSELRARTITWWIILGLITVVLLLGTIATLVLFGLISFLALKEYLSMIPTRRADRSVLLWAYLAIPIQYYLIAIQWYGVFIIFIPVYLFLFLPAVMVLRGETDGFLRAAGTMHWGVMLCVFAISHAAYLLEGLPAETGALRSVGGELLVFLLVLTALNDVLQYTSGKLLGKKLFGDRKLAPSVSPNKTWEGFLGGLIGTAVLAVLLNMFLTPLSWQHALMLGAILSIAGLFGDLVMSALKRDLGLKDTGSVLPGHGGILDRIDSLIFTAPLFVHLVRYMYF